MVTSNVSTGAPSLYTPVFYLLPLLSFREGCPVLGTPQTVGQMTNKCLAE